MVNTPSSRFFVALRPDPASAGRLARLAAGVAMRCHGRALAACDLHLTLAFIGELPAADGPRLARLLDGLPAIHPGFSLDRLGRFGPALVWIGPDQAPGWLGPLARTVCERLRAGSVGFDERPFKPHLTLVRNARDRAAVERETGKPASAGGACIAHWRLALGGSRPASSPERRYQWRHVRHAVIEPSPASHNLYDTETCRQQ